MTDHRTRSRPTVRRSIPLLAELDREWDRLDRRPATMRTVRGWVAEEDPGGPVATALSTATTLDSILDASHARTGPVGDRVLLWLVDLAASEWLAGRIVLQRVLPGLIAATARADRDDRRLDHVVGAAWLAIRDFDTDRRRRHVAASLISDTVWQAFRRAERRRCAGELPLPSDLLERRAAPPRRLDPIVGLAGTVRAAERAGVADSHLDLIRALARAGSPAVLARQCSVTARTIRNRRDTAVAGIRSALGPDWADWADPLTAAA